MDPGLKRRRAEQLLEQTLTAGVYFTAAKLGLRLAFEHPSASPVWPPTGIALAVLLLRGPWLWPAVFVGAFFANVTNVATQGAVGTSLGIALGNTLEAFLGAALIRRFAGGADALDSPGNVFRWTLLGAMLAPAVSATLGVASLYLGGHAAPSDLSHIWATWWLGDAGGALVLAPVLIAWARPSSFPWTRRRAAEAVLVAAALLILSGLVFGTPFRWVSHTYPLPFTLPLLAWAAFRLGRRGTATAVLILAILSIWGTLEGLGSFARSDPGVSLLLLQIFLSVSSATALTIAASVDERKRAEQNLALLAAAVESSEDAITVLTPDGMITRWNKAAEKLYGYTEAEVQGKPFSFVVPEDLRHGEEVVLERVLRGERIEHYETRRRRKDGSTVDVSLTISPVRDRGGRIVAASKTARDITDRKRAREEIVRLNADLEQRVQERTARLQSAVGELESFTYTVAHDLRAPLRGIHQFSDLILEEKSPTLDEESRAWLLHIIDGARRMDSLIEGLLAYSRIGRQEISLSTQDLSGLVAEILIHLKGEIALRKATVEVSPDLPRVLGNPLLLTQALTNLLSNAIKFVPPERDPVVRISATARGATVRIFVEDNGIGIEPRHHDRLFRIFERLHPRDQFAGNGIGLAIVKKAVEQMGGAVGIESKDGPGTRFTVDLPAARRENPPAAPA
jgi:PAS domain S-box-containing protein